MFSIRCAASAFFLAVLLYPAALAAQSAEELAQVFTEADGDQNGDLTPEELSQAIEAAPDSNRVGLIVVILDADGSDSLSLQEFQDIGAIMRGEMTDAQFGRFFAFFDRNGDGAIDRAEFLAAVDFMGGQQDQATSDAEFNGADLNGDGRLELEEFKTLQ